MSDQPTKMTGKVAFCATLSDNGAYGPFGQPKDVPFNKVITNIGNCYNGSTGVFTAPVDGVYYFSFFYHAGGNRPSGLQLVKNCQMIVQSGDHASKCDTADNGGNVAVLQLNQNDRVYVQLPATCHVWGGGDSTTFSGFLLS
ncbi:complement C1q-like protein 4 [Acanthopagrus latus]|uniref:complement C1q-like protein 4 n=1 Tax=Acanthopagrus latus TaxID=8177 RepID=UPI00187CEB61|nr:complement C1q-like protein 4 [Acanthopagrus latus]